MGNKIYLQGNMFNAAMCVLFQLDLCISANNCALRRTFCDVVQHLHNMYCTYLVQEMVKLQVIAVFSLRQSQVHHLLFKLKLALKLHKPLHVVFIPLTLLYFYYHVFVLTENLSNSPSTPAITKKPAKACKGSRNSTSKSIFTTTKFSSCGGSWTLN